MDAKNLKNSRLADLVLKRYHVHAKISEIPGSSIVSNNAVIELAEFGEGASVFAAYFLLADGTAVEKASVSVVGTVATLNFTTNVALTDTIDLYVDLDL
jgi:hypothetical protein